ncbi:MAG: AI-2E family transporter [Candidatus Binatia bacterium]
MGRTAKIPLSVLPGLVLVIASLYWAQTFFIPLALSLLFTFLLTPLVAGLEKFGLRRVPSVVVVVLLVFSLMGGIAWIVAVQFTSVANQLPGYQSNIRQKIVDIRGVGKGGVFEKVKETAKEVTEELKNEPSAAQTPREVVVQGDETTTFWPFSPVAAPMLERMAGAGFVIVLTVFMMIRRENLRDRLIHLLGYGRLTVTTRAPEEAGQRISRYLIVQSLLNGSFGIAVGGALFFFGLPYAILWGFLAALLRFIPYIGSWAAAILPTALALAVFQGWLWPLLVFALIVGMEIVIATILEPLLYGESAGVSEVGMLVSVAFWTWLWGPVGLLLAMPLTVCVVVIAKYMPPMEFIGVLLSDGSFLEPAIGYYQRLLAADRAEAKAIVGSYAEKDSPAQVYDNLMVPALGHAKRDLLQGNVSEAELQFVVQTTREILAEPIFDTSVETAAENGNSPINRESEVTLSKLLIIGCPARDESDELVLVMLSQLLDRKRFELEIVGAAQLTSEILARTAETKAALLCIASLSPDGLPHTRALCKRVRRRFPEIKILIARLGNGTTETDDLMAAGADKISTTMIEFRDQVAQISQVIVPKPYEGETSHHEVETTNHPDRETLM